MTEPRVHAAWLLPLGLAACPSSSAPRDATRLVPIVERVEAIDSRLAAIESTLDALSTTLDSMSGSMRTIAQLAAPEMAEDDAWEERRRERVHARAELRERLGIAAGGPPPPRPPAVAEVEPTGEDSGDSGGATADSTRRPYPFAAQSHQIEGAAQSIWCESPRDQWTRCAIDRAFVDRLVSSTGLLTHKQGRYLPSLKDGRPRGIKVYAIRRGSLPKLLGLRNGDLIEAVNGRVYERIEDVVALVVGPPPVTHFDVELERRGELEFLTIDIVE